jgi:hypothetical protein
VTKTEERIIHREPGWVETGDAESSFSHPFRAENLKATVIRVFRDCCVNAWSLLELDERR